MNTQDELNSKTGLVNLSDAFPAIDLDEIKKSINDQNNKPQNQDEKNDQENGANADDKKIEKQITQDNEEDLDNRFKDKDVTQLKGKDFATVRYKLKTYEKEIVPKLNKEIEELKKQLSNNSFKEKIEEYEKQVKLYQSKSQELENKLQEYDKRLLLSDIKNHPIYDQYVKEPRNKAIEKIKSLSKEYGFTYKDFEEAIHTEDEHERKNKLNDIADQISSKIDQSEFVAAYKLYINSLESEKYLLENPNRTKAELEKQEELKHAKEKEIYFQAQEKLHKLLSEEDEVFSNFGDIVKEEAKKFVRNISYDKLTAEDKAALAYGYFMNQVLRDYAIAANDKIKDLEKSLKEANDKLKQYLDSKPKVSGDRAPSQEDITRLSIKDAFRALINQE